MVRVKRPTRSKTSQRVNKDNDPSICLTGVNSEVEQHGKENPHASSHNMNHDLEDCPVVEMDICKDIATDQLSKPCDGETNILTSDPGSTTFNNFVDGMELNSHRRSECRTKGSLLSVEPLATYYRKRKGFLRSVKPLKTYHRRRSGYVTLGINPLPIQNSLETKVEDMDLCHPVKNPMLCVVNNTCKNEMTAGESSNITGNVVPERDINGESHVDHVAAESENSSNPVLPKSACAMFTEVKSAVTTQEQSMELDQSEKSDMVVACDVLVAGKNNNKSTSYVKNDASSLIISDTEHVERKQDDVEESSLVSSETMEQQRMSQPGTADVKLLPEEASSFSIKRKLLVLDINGLLADIVPVARVSPEYVPDPESIVAGKAVFKRPFCDEFLEFCFERFNVGVWSSRTKKNVGSVLDLLVGKVRQNLLFFWDQSHCTCTRYYTPDNEDKPLFFKKLNKLWEKSESNLPWRRGDYDESNTLLLDDSPYKALLNPPNTAIFPYSYQYNNEKDNSLGPGGDLRTYLEGLSLAPNVQEYVKKNSYGQDPITENHVSWSFYHEVIESTVVGSLRKPYQSLVSSEKLRKDVSQGNNTSVIAETSKESLNSNGTSQQLKNSIPILLVAGHYDRQLMENAKADGNSSGSPSSIQRGYKRGRESSRSQSPRDETSRRQSHSLSPKKCRRSKSPEPSHGSSFGGDNTRRYQNQTLRQKCLNFSQGRCLRGASCYFVHHPSCYQFYPDRRVQEHEGQILERKYVPRECYDFNQGKCKWGASCRFLHSVPEKANLGTEGNETHGKQWDNISRDKAVPRECYAFIQGKCKWGESCRFLHNVPDKVDVGTEANETHDKQWDKSAHKVCNDFIQGKCNWGESCRFLHSVPDKADFGTEANETHGKECYNIRRENAEPRQCNDFKLGKCNWGASCRFLHSVPDKADFGTDANETHGKECYNIRRENAEPRQCNDFKLGKCNWGASCRFLHSVPDKADFGTDANETHGEEFYNIRRENAEPRQCNDFKLGKCNWGASCRFLHSVPDKADFGTDAIRRENAEPRQCNDFKLGKCNWGASCRFLHSVPDKADFGTDANETHGEEFYNIRRENAEPRQCNDFKLGKCNWGASCRFLHSVPDKADFGTDANETHGKECYNIRRENTEPRQCNDFNRGKCNWGASCRFLHSVPDKTDRLSSFHDRQYQDAPSSSKISNDCVEAQRSSFNEHGRYKALPEVCRNYTQGRCYRESYCRYLHQEFSVTVGSGSTSQLGDTSRHMAVRVICKNYTQGICHKGSDCLYLHQEPGLTGLGSTSQLGETTGFKSLPEVCRNYTQGRCHKGSDCRFLHREPGMDVGSGSTSQLGEISRFKAVPEVSNCRYLHREPGMGVGSGSTSQLGEISRFKVVPEVCRNNTQGRCHNGSNCRYLHQELGLKSGSGSAQFGETSRYKSLPEVCRNYIHGRCHKGSDCRFLHQESGVTVGSGSTGQFDETSSSKARLEVCRNYTQDKCHKGSECRYLHQEQGSCRSTSRTEKCFDYTRGKCYRGVHCRYIHPEPDESGSTKFYRSHQQDQNDSSNSKSFGSCGDEKGDAVETLPNEPINKESFREASTVPDDDAKDINHLENGVHLSMGNLGDSDRMILDADNIIHERPVHEDTESGTKELIVDFSVNEEKRGLMEALPNHPICNDSYEKASVVIEDDTKQDRVPENLVCCATMDNLGDSHRMIPDADNSSHERSDHEDTGTGTKELNADFFVNEENRGTMEALPNHPIHKDSYEKASVVLEDDTKDVRVPENVVCASSMDNLGDSDRMIQDSDNQPEQVSDL